MNRARPTASAVALATLTEIYGDSRHMPEMAIPVERFDESPERGEHVEVLDAAGDVVRGKVVRLVAIVQPDFDTYQAAGLRGQEGLPL